MNRRSLSTLLYTLFSKSQQAGKERRQECEERRLKWRREGGGVSSFHEGCEITLGRVLFPLQMAQRTNISVEKRPTSNQPTISPKLPASAVVVAVDSKQPVEVGG